MNIGFAGTPNIAKIILSNLVKNNVIPQIILTKPSAKKRNKIIKNPVSKFAEDNNIKVIESIDSLEIKKAIKNIDLMIVVAYGRILSESLLKIPKFGWINIHYSKLPDLRGSAPIQRAILRGDNKFYATIFKIDSGIDTGNIYTTFSIEEKNNNTDNSAEEILEKLSEESTKPLLKIINNINVIETKKQIGNATYAHKIKKTELEIKNNDTVNDNINKIRIGGAYFFYKNKRIEIIEAIKEKGEGIQFIMNGRIKLIKVKPENRSVMLADDWVRGLK